MRCVKVFSGEERKDLCEGRSEPVNPYAWIFPPFVVTALFSGEASQPPHPEEMTLMRGVAPQRASQFAAGRICARRVLSDLGIKAGPLLVGANGAPAWPKGIVGSISHTTGCCVAAACRLRDAIGLGVDVEAVDVVSEDIVPLLGTEAERAWARSIPCGRGPALLFSSKESLFKGYHPLTGFFLEFSDVVITLDPASNRFSARLVNDQAPSISGAREFHGRYWIDDRFVYTGLFFMGRVPNSAGTHPATRPGCGSAPCRPEEFSFDRVVSVPAREFKNIDFSKYASHGFLGDFASIGNKVLR